MDLWKLVFVIVLVAATVGAVVWLSSDVVTSVIDSGTDARAALAASNGSESAWGLVSSAFGTSLGSAFTIALEIAGAIFGVLFLMRLLRWVNGA